MQKRLIAIRRYFGYTQKDIADYLRIDLRTYVKKERGDSQFKSNEMFALSRKFNKRIDEIFLPTNFMNYEVDGGTSEVHSTYHVEKECEL